MRIGPVHDTGLSAVLWSSIPATASIVAPQELELELDSDSSSTRYFDTVGPATERVRHVQTCSNYAYWFSFRQPGPACIDAKVIWQKAASPSCHLSQLQMDSPDLDRHLIHSSLDPWVSLQTASQLVQPFLHSTSVWPTHRQTDTHTTLRATSVATGRIYTRRACNVA